MLIAAMSENLTAWRKCSHTHKMRKSTLEHMVPAPFRVMLEMRPQGSTAVRLIQVLCTSIACFAVTQFAAASVINLPGNGDRIGEFGTSRDSYTLGEVFTAPQSMLDQYRFSLAFNRSGPLDMMRSFPFLSQIYAWDGLGIVGPSLFTSDVLMTTGSLNSYYFQPSISLTQGARYIAIITNAPPDRLSLGGFGQGNLEATSIPATDDLFFAITNDSRNWTRFEGGNAAFQADFSNAPASPEQAISEPSTIALIGMALLSLCALGIARRCEYEI